MTEQIPCHDCDAKPGELHGVGCDNESCALCGCQVIGCGCVYEINGIDVSELETSHPEIYKNGPTDEMYAKLDDEVAKYGGRIPWSGETHDAAACREFGFWTRWDDANSKWESVPADHPEAREDLNRIHRYSWSREQRRRVVTS